jgi:hypothetical protein
MSIDFSEKKKKKQKITTMTVTAMTTAIALIFLVGSLAIVPTVNNQKANAQPSLTTSDFVCSPTQTDPPEVEFNIIGTGYPPNSQLRTISVVEGSPGGTLDGTFTGGFPNPSDSNGDFNVHVSTPIIPRTFTYTVWVDLNGNNQLDSEDASATTTFEITGTECDEEEPEPPLTEQFDNQGQCIREANTNPDSGITRQDCQDAFVTDEEEEEEEEPEVELEEEEPQQEE